MLWLRDVGRRQWVAIGRDTTILKTPSELAVLKAAKIHMFLFSGRGDAGRVGGGGGCNAARYLHRSHERYAGCVAGPWWQDTSPRAAVGHASTSKHVKLIRRATLSLAPARQR